MFFPPGLSCTWQEEYKLLKGFAYAIFLVCHGFSPLSMCVCAHSLAHWLSCQPAATDRKKSWMPGSIYFEQLFCILCAAHVSVIFLLLMLLPFLWDPTELIMSIWGLFKSYLLACFSQLERWGAMYCIVHNEPHHDLITPFYHFLPWLSRVYRVTSITEQNTKT